jgi:hypothetical protein
MKKTVILVWTQNCKNCKTTSTDNYWGLGDLIRGAIKLFQLSKKMNFNLIVNTILHPVSLHLKKQTSEYDDLIMANKHNIEFVFPGNVENHIENSQNKTIYFLTNDFCDEDEITDECKEFIKTILTPSNDILNLLENYNSKNYNILHMRFGDEFITNKDIIDDNFIDSVKTRIANNMDAIFMCDSFFVKERLKKDGFFENSNISFIDLDGGHIGYEQDAEKIRNTLLEFFIISKSNSIKTYSVYSWVSGFVFWTVKLYDIPLIRIN